MTGSHLSAAAYALESADRAAPAPIGALPAMDDLVTKFMSATWRQVNCFQDLSARVDRLEEGLDNAPLREAMRDICLSLEKFVGRTESGAIRAETGIAALADAAELLDRKVAAGREEVQNIRQAIHEQIAGFSELVRTVQARMEQLENALAEMKTSEARIATHAQILAGQIDALRGQADSARQEAEKSAAELREQDTQSLARTEALAADIEALRGRLDAAEGEKGVLRERLQVAETGLASAREKELALGQMYARLAQAYAPAA